MTMARDGRENSSLNDPSRNLSLLQLVLPQHPPTILHGVRTSKTSDSENLTFYTLFIAFLISCSKCCESRAFVTNVWPKNNVVVIVRILRCIGVAWRYSVNLIFLVFILFFFQSWNIFVWFYYIGLCVLHRCVGT
jgi:hypothetical protein